MPYHTRVIILDDPLERRPVNEQPNIIKEKPDDKENIHLLFKEDIIKGEEDKLVYTEEINGYLLGFVICSEKDYIRNPEVISERIKELPKEECKKIILKCLWNNHDTEKHTAVQEAMARKGVKAGADLVIGFGNKAFLGCEWKENSLILYGLGKSNEKKANKQKSTALMAEVIFSTNHYNHKPIVILYPEPVVTDMQQIIEQFIGDSIGTGISQICFYQDNQSKQ